MRPPKRKTHARQQNKRVTDAGDFRGTLTFGQEAFYQGTNCTASVTVVCKPILFEESIHGL
jgi:hypothetical protein